MTLASVKVLYSLQVEHTNRVWHDGTLDHHLMNGKVVLSDEAGESIAEDFKFIQASHKVWSQGHSLELDSKCIVEVVGFIRASRQDIRSFVRPLGSRSIQPGLNQTVQATSSSAPSYGRFVLPGQDDDEAGYQASQAPRAPASRGHFAIPIEGDDEAPSLITASQSAAGASFGPPATALNEALGMSSFGTQRSSLASKAQTERVSNEAGTSQGPSIPSNTKRRRLGTTLRR
ncbi:unnamed protein product [Tilletia controversa]|uniref:5'-3' DNA helicase ZGRF1-like N-terminal domain-containing protein n=1 Tax=Tilletia laevis TaxID=157183 RepID=A0A9N8LY63_9BASI|nr:unnamed protein product [Tilletia caries]CAD6918146.1 unnamed protein product [Tilletia laevis]CAD6925074.1 unnamed protein product [Tilletia controversa]CAD6904086.1 unnamed protein product [Tilletia caries]CAD6942042.1 unnamed protein product [Tilletia controversa]